MKRYLRNTVFFVASILFYLLWNGGGETVYAKLLAGGIEQFAPKFSSVEKAYVEHEKDGKAILCIQYPGRTTQVGLEHCLPIVILFAWQLSLFFDSRIRRKRALKFFAINFLVVFILQFLFPLLLNLGESKIKTAVLFMGFQIFGFIIFFLILKDSILIRLQAERQKRELAGN
ncbi:MAG: hypothetical protein ACK5M7_15465 [Draconibacterium sp.]